MSFSIYKSEKKDFKMGFTLVELLVSVSVFTVIMMISMGAILVVLDSNRKSANLQFVMDNVSSAVESMSRNIRFGSNYRCQSVGVDPNDCDPVGSSGFVGTYVTFLDTSGATITYSLSGGRILKTVGASSYYLTSPDITIQSLSFIVRGSPPNIGSATTDYIQPYVVILIRGYSGNKLTLRTYFDLQSSISQRKLDYQ